MIIHPGWAPHRAISRRWGCSSPNMMNVPGVMRDLFVPRDPQGWFVGADYASLELRIIALLTGDEGLLACYDQGLDAHWHNARNVFGLTRGLQVEKDITKTCTFGFCYQSSDDVQTVWRAAVVRLSEKYPDIAQLLTLPRASRPRRPAS